MKCVFIGLVSQQKGYKCLSASGKIFISRHIVFDQTLFPFRTGFMRKLNTDQEQVSPAPFIIQTGRNSRPIAIREDDNESLDSQNLLTDQQTSHNTEVEECESCEPEPPLVFNSYVPEPNSNIDNSNGDGPTNHHSMVTRFKVGITWPKTPYIRLLKAAVELISPTRSKPGSVHEALSSSQWRTTIKEEFEALLWNRT